jgi:hypothetical protein
VGEVGVVGEDPSVGEVGLVGFETLGEEGLV